MLNSPKRHWPEYLMKAAGLGMFMISACLIVTLLEHPASPVRQALTFFRLGKVVSASNSSIIFPREMIVPTDGPTT